MSRHSLTDPQSTGDQIADPVIDVPAVDKPLWQLGRRAAVIAACVGFSALAACSVSLGTQSVEEASDIDVGECLQIGGEAGDGKVEATTADCEGTEGLTFYAADKVGASAECGTPNTSALTFGEGDQKLCLTPNFAVDKCYQIPISGGKLADYREVECTASPADSTILAKTVSRGGDSLTCTEDETKWAFAQPLSVGYCLTEDITAAGRFDG